MISASLARFSKLENISENERSVLRAEADAVRQRVAHARLAWYARHVIEIAFRVGNVQIQSRRNEVFLHGEENRANAGGSACPLRMTDHRRRRAHGYPAGPLFEVILDGSCVDPIVKFG